jgi:hypothetical protein
MQRCRCLSPPELFSSFHAAVAEPATPLARGQGLIFPSMAPPVLARAPRWCWIFEHSSALDAPPRTAMRPLPVDSSLLQGRRRILSCFHPAAAVPGRLPADYGLPVQLATLYSGNLMEKGKSVVAELAASFRDIQVAPRRKPTSNLPGPAASFCKLSISLHRNSLIRILQRS